MRLRILAAGGAALLLASCGYIGDPLPPLANVPVRVTDLAAIQRGGVVIAHFTVPQLTTESKPIPLPLTLDLRAGPNAGDHFDQNQWAAQARHIPAPEITGALATYNIPCGEWLGKEVLLSVRITAGNGKQSEWSNIVIVPVVAAPAVPGAVTATATAQGVRVAWRAPEGRFRVLRAAEGGEYAVAVTVDKPEWIDTAAEFGKPYRYRVQAIVPLENNKEAESEISSEVEITPKDTFPPAVPAGLRADAAPGSIELAWDRDPDPDLAGYRIYRAAGNGNFEKLAEVSQIPAYSDHAVQHGTRYRYAVTAFDRNGNESGKSGVVEVGF
ncbi:MAG: hypothetical protein JST11_29480 [Acidobacteria bacterium]|nr:hypothetical protein [Acidobacteriota bacterium]